jgi:hypothetical protein
VLDAPASVAISPTPHEGKTTTPGYGVSVTVSGKGTVTAPGIRCGGTRGTLFDCENYFAPRAAVKLTARPAKHAKFAGWSQFCRGTKLHCTLLVVAPMTVGAVFRH